MTARQAVKLNRIFEREFMIEDAMSKGHTRKKVEDMLRSHEDNSGGLSKAQKQTIQNRLASITNG